MSKLLDITIAWDELQNRVTKILKSKNLRNYTYRNNRHEEWIIIYIGRDPQHILLKVSVDFKFKTLLEKDKEMIDIFSQDATITELIKQTESYKNLVDSLQAYRDEERASTIYNRLSG
jgi:hypothetical protein